MLGIHNNQFTLEVTLNPRRSNTLRQHSRAPLDRPRDQQDTRILVQLLGDFHHGRVIDNSAGLGLVCCGDHSERSTFIPWQAGDVVSKRTVSHREDVLELTCQ